MDLFAEWDAKNKRTVMIRQAVLLRASEVDALESLGKRVGSTLMVMLRLAYMGQVLGFTYRSNAATLEPHTYRLCLTVGVQPEHAKPLLGPEALSGGTAGRFLWARQPHWWGAVAGAPTRPGGAESRSCRPS